MSNHDTYKRHVFIERVEPTTLKLYDFASSFARNFHVEALPPWYVRRRGLSVTFGDSIVEVQIGFNSYCVGVSLCYRTFRSPEHKLYDSAGKTDLERSNLANSGLVEVHN